MPVFDLSDALLPSVQICRCTLLYDRGSFMVEPESFTLRRFGQWAVLVARYKQRILREHKMILLLALLLPLEIA